jgi:thiol-disulfide isomerase/thioredoxin
MPTDIQGERVIVVVFAMPDCPACEEYLPRFLARAEAYRKAGVPVFVYDVSSEDPKLNAFADRYKIRATPTTLVLPRGAGMLRAEGALPDASIEVLLRKAYGIHLGTYALTQD